MTIGFTLYQLKHGCSAESYLPVRSTVFFKWQGTALPTELDTFDIFLFALGRWGFAFLIQLGWSTEHVIKQIDDTSQLVTREQGSWACFCMFYCQVQYSFFQKLVFAHVCCQNYFLQAKLGGSTTACCSLTTTGLDKHLKRLTWVYQSTRRVNRASIEGLLGRLTKAVKCFYV